MTQPAGPPRRDPDDPATWSLARHEAGHAVAAVALGRSFRHVTLRPVDSRFRGVLVGHRMQPRPLAGLVVQIAGCLAIPDDSEALSVDYAALYCGRGRFDLENIAEYSDGLPHASLTQLARRAWRIVRGTHAPSVAAVAEALVDHPEQTLTHHDVRTIVDDHQPGGLLHLLKETRAAVAAGSP
jgi:hypothetical protein